MHKSILLKAHLSHSSDYSMVGVPRQIQGLAAVTGLTATIVCLPPPEDKRVVFDPGREGSPVFSRCAWDKHLGFKRCVRILSTPVGLIN